VRIIIECPERILHLEAGYIYADCPLAQFQTSCSPAADHTLTTTIEGNAWELVQPCPFLALFIAAGRSWRWGHSASSFLRSNSNDRNLGLASAPESGLPQAIMMTIAGRPSTEISASTHGRACPSPVLTTQPMAESLTYLFR